MKKFYIIVLLFSACTTLKSQINLNIPYQGTQTFEIPAPEYIRMLPGFDYQPQSPNYFRAYIDPNAITILPVEYTDPIDPETRPLNTNLAVGTTSGQAGVTLTGGATYSIPLFSPPGAAGMQPNLSLIYSSQSGNGIAGYGWNISGLSAITRMPHTIYHDGDVKGVDFVDDRFMLDGQRLIKVSGNYGADLSTYYTEVFNGSKIEAQGILGGAPEWFKVYNKDGSIVEYGNTDDSRFKSQLENKATVSWNINRITDANDNYIQFNYHRGDIECYITEIKYTGNDSDPGNLLAPYNSIKFYYSERTDKSTGFIAGSRIEQNVLLHHIDILAENEIVKTYKLKYYFDLNSKLNEVEEYGRDNKKYNSTVFGYEKIILAQEKHDQFWVGGDYYDRQFYYGDFNGDGLSDLFILYVGTEKKWEIKLKSGSDFVDSPGWNGDLTNTHNFRAIIGDYNGDGFSDVLLNEIGSGYLPSIKGFYSTGHSMVGNLSNLTIDYYYSNIVSGDYDGNGKDEFLMYKETVNSQGVFVVQMKIMAVHSIDFNTGNVIFSTLFDNNITLTYSLYSDLIDVFFRDFDGDGKPEVAMHRYSDEHSFVIYKLATDGTNQYEKKYDTGFPSKYHKIYFGDFNGDGKCDLLTWNTSLWSVDLSTGNDFVPSNYIISDALAPSGPNDAIEFQIRDYDQDGKDDIANVVKAYVGSKIYCNLYRLIGNAYNHDQFLITENQGITIFAAYETGSAANQDFNGDGNADFVFTAWGTNENNQCGYGIYHLLYNPDKNPLLLNSISNGLNSKNKFTFTTLTDNTIYTKGSSAPTNCRDIQYPISVVSKFETENGLGAFSSTFYKYKEAILHLKGKGFLGFKEILTSSDISPIKTYTYSEIYDSYYYLVPTEIITYMDSPNFLISASIPLSDKIINYESTNKVFLPFQPVVTNYNYITGVKTKTETTLDQWGNTTNSKTSYYTTNAAASLIGFSQTTPTNYISAGSWCPSKPTDVTTTLQRTDEDAFIKTNHYNYRVSDGRLDISVDFYGTPKAVTTAYWYYTNGLPQYVSVNSSGLSPRLVSYVYDDKSRFVTRTTDAENLVSSASYDPAFGNKLTTTDANGLKTTTTYDGFGAPVRTTDPEGVYAQTGLQWYSGTDKPNVLFYSESTSNNAPTANNYYDKFGRVLYASNQDFALKNVFTKTQYNSKGLVTSISEPYFGTGSPTLFTSSTYDDFNRPTAITLPTGVILTNNNPTPASPGLTSSVTNSATGITTSKTMDAMGKVASATDPGGTINYTYFSSGNTKNISSPDGSITSMTYDAYDRQFTLADPDAGTMSYEYNAFGELTDQTDANQTHFIMTYDKLGRLLTKTCSNDNSVTTNTYNPATAPNAKGLLSSTIYSNGTSFSYLYDNFSRIIQKNEHADTDFNYFYTYDSKGNLLDYQYPSGFTITNTYLNGFLTRISAKTSGSSIYAPKEYNVRGQLHLWDNGAGDIIHNINEYDQFGFPTNVQCGLTANNWNIQNLETNFNTQTGNLLYRKDKNFMLNGSFLSETFGYDPVHKNQLSWAQLPSQYPTFVTYNSQNGNITQKTDMGSYQYNTANKPHAVQTITDLVQLPTEASQTINYNNFNKVEEIIHSDLALRLKITYGPDEQRVKSEYFENNTTLKKTKYFIGGDYEVERLPNGAERRIHYLPGGGLYVSTQYGPSYMYYIQSDYQGNWYSVTDATGNVLERYSFDAWGKRRNATNWSSTGVPTTFLFDRGYTGHEMLDAFGLINMNGRVYDPVIARFLSPDNYVQAPDNSQGFNRYSYCLNNPLMFTDPSGEFWHLIIGAAIGGIVNWATHGAEFNAKGLEYFGVGALAGALAAGVGAGVSAAIAGAGHAGVSGATFATGFMGTSTAISTGIASGFVSGASAGLTSGFVTGFGNTALTSGTDIGDMFSVGLNYGWKGAIMGGIAGGITGGIDAIIHDKNILTGAGHQNVVFSIDKSGKVSITDADKFESYYSKTHLDDYTTDIAHNPSIKSELGTDGYYHTQIELPKNVHGSSKALMSDPSSGVKSYSIIKGTAKIISYNPVKSLVLYGWRYNSSPLNSFSDLFHSRIFTWPW